MPKHTPLTPKTPANFLIQKPYKRDGKTAPVFVPIGTNTGALSPLNAHGFGCYSFFMKVVLVVTDPRGKSLAFVSDALKAISLEEAVRLANEGKIDGAHVVRRTTGAYIRTNMGVPKMEEFDQLSVSGRALLLYAEDARHAVSTPALSAYINRHTTSFKEREPFIAPVGQPKVLTTLVKKKLEPHRAVIFSAAAQFSLDAYLLGAIIVDEIARMHPFEQMIDALGARIVGRNVSVGIAQVKIDTAHDLIKRGLYHPNPTDKKLPFKKLDAFARVYLYTYLIQPKHNISFAAAFVRYVIDFWASKIDLTERPEIIATLYSIGCGEPKLDPKASDRGTQIAGEWHSLAKKWLNEP